MKKTFLLIIILSCSLFMPAQVTKSKGTADKGKSSTFAPYRLSADLSHLSKSEKELIPIFIEIANIMDDLFWKQTYGDKQKLMEQITEPDIRTYAEINYGPWDRLNDNKPFVKGYDAKPDVCTYYPLDMSEKEFEACKDKNKNSLYTVLRRDEKGNLIVRWYHEEYKEEIEKVCSLLDKAISITDNPEMKKYLTERKKAFETDDYFESDMAWMDMKNSNIDFVVGPIENYDDKFMEAKASYEAFVLVKDVERSKQLAHFVKMLPDIQKILPCDPKYKTFVPGTESDLNVYNAIYYAGDCNAGSKTIAINLPNDDRVQAKKGARRLQLRNSMQAKFDKIMRPIGKTVLNPDQLKHLKFDAFFWNVTFHEVGHGLGIKETVNKKGSVDDAMKTEKTSWEEAKADILGLFIVCHLIDKKEITNITKEDAITTFITGLFRSVRFGSASSHGKANMMCYNVMKEQGAFTRDENGIYTINFEKAEKAISYWAGLILKTQGDGDFEFAKKFREKNGMMTPELQKDIQRINEAGIPRDIRFKQGLQYMDEQAQKTIDASSKKSMSAPMNMEAKEKKE
ncbi:MAG: Zn-dependent hydrolase [Bacteroidales bacterium]|nr:Zn-dependent hydrolase [Bacteroidales bacterium]